MLATCYYAGLLLDLFFCTQDGGDMILQNYISIRVFQSICRKIAQQFPRRDYKHVSKQRDNLFSRPVTYHKCQSS
jgi:hypothetical protein